MVAELLSGRPVLPAAHRSDIYLTALGALLTLVYMAGLIFRPRVQRLRLGLDSRVVLVLYALGVAGLLTIA
jgi:cation:H+ antiporter